MLKQPPLCLMVPPDHMAGQSAKRRGFVMCKHLQHVGRPQPDEAQMLRTCDVHEPQL